MKRIGIIIAIPSEAKCFRLKKLALKESIQIEKNIFLYISGIGFDAATSAAKELVKKNIDGLISWGMAGGIDQSLKTGDIVLADTIQNDKEIFYTSNEWRNSISSHLQTTPYKVLNGKIVTTNKILDSSIKKRELSNQTKALAVDMESAAIAKISLEKKIKYVSARVIIDDAYSNIPSIFLENIDNFGKIKIKSFLKSSLQNPFQLFQLISLIKSYIKSLSSLNNMYDEFKKRDFFIYNKL